MATNTNIDATEMLHQLAVGSTTAEQLISRSIEKLKADNGRLNAATEIMQPDITHLPGGILRGLPISVKECYAIAGKRINSGSVRMKPIDCKEDAVVVDRLKKAGAVIVARGNTSEFLLGRETNNLLYGTTDNALWPGLTAGGSSGGDGSMTATGGVVFGIGTDIGGSCRYPAVFNGIVGFKPASGLIDKRGIFPVAGNEFVETMNSPGILCRSVRDARLVYNVIADKPLDKTDDINDVQIYVSSDFRVKVVDTSIQQALDGSVDFLKKNSFKTTDLHIPESGAHYWDFGTLMAAGFADKIYEWSKTEKGESLSFMGELLRRMKGKPTLSDELFAMLLPFNFLKPSAAKLQKVISKTQAAREKYRSILKNNGVLILPTVGILAPKHKKFTPQYNKMGVVEIITPVSFCNIYNLSCITLPAWKYQADKAKNPPGIQLAVAQGNEDLLLKVAELLESHLQKQSHDL